MVVIPKSDYFGRSVFCSSFVSPAGVASSRMVVVSASVGLSLHHKVQKFSFGTDSTGWSRKRAVKRIWCGLCFVVLYRKTHYLKAGKCDSLQRVFATLLIITHGRRRFKTLAVDPLKGLLCSLLMLPRHLYFALCDACVSHILLVVSSDVMRHYLLI